jgi:predicted Ser/Thr protein kinase
MSGEDRRGANGRAASSGARLFEFELDGAGASDAGAADVTTGSFGGDPLVGHGGAAGGAARLPPGTLLGGRFRIEGELGHGGMGVVYDAIDTTLGEPVAIKVIRPERAPSPAVRARFLDEVRLARRVVHPGIVRVFELGEEAGAPFVAMERLDGEDLGRVIASGREVPILEALDWVIQACDALDAAHDEGIVHRDVKPTNLFLTGAGAIKVLDFGLAAAMDARGAGPAGASGGAAGAVGTPAFMAPEQRDPERFGAPSPATDVWALARVLTELLARSSPGDRADEAPSVPHALVEVVLAALADDPAQRPASAGHLARALRACAARVAPRRLPTRRLVALAVLGVVLIGASAAVIERGVSRWWRGEIETALEERDLARAAALALASFPDSRGREPWFKALAATVEDRGHALLRGGRALEAIGTFQLARALGAGGAGEGLARAREARAIELAARTAPPPVPAGPPPSTSGGTTASDPSTAHVVLRSPHAAAVYADGQPLGLTPYEGELPAGLHRLRFVDLDTGAAHDEIVSIPAGTAFERTWPATK